MGKMRLEDSSRLAPNRLRDCTAMHQASGAPLLPDFSRMVKINGPFERKTAYKALQEIKGLARQSSQPITLQIASGGGDMKAFWLLERAFKLHTREGSPFRFVTFAHSTANSAAAYLLVRGHAAYVGPNARMVFHGIRYGNLERLRSVKREAAFAIAMRLETKNRRVAIKLAKAMMPRLALKLKNQQESSPQPRTNSGNALALLRKFVQSLGAKSSSDQIRMLVDEALGQVEAIWPMAVEFQSMLTNPPPASGRLAVHANIMKAAVASKIKRQLELQGVLDETALIEVMLDYLLFKDILSKEYGLDMQTLLGQLGPDVLTIAESVTHAKRAQKAPRAARNHLVQIALPRLTALWLFALALCRRLMMGETKLTAGDALDLCLIDGIWAPVSHHPAASSTIARPPAAQNEPA